MCRASYGASSFQNGIRPLPGSAVLLEILKHYFVRWNSATASFSSTSLNLHRRLEEKGTVFAHNCRGPEALSLLALWVFSLKRLYEQRTLSNYLIVQLAACPVIGRISPPLYKLVVCERDSCINSIERCSLLTAVEWSDVCPWTQIRMQLHSTGVRHIHKHIFSPMDGHLWLRGVWKVTKHIVCSRALCYSSCSDELQNAIRTISPATPPACCWNWLFIHVLFQHPFSSLSPWTSTGL